jgi:glutathione S-transferase
MITLYYLPGSAALAPHLALEEAGAQYDLVLVEREDGRTTFPPNFLELNPHGRVPALIDGDLRLYEAAAIVMHLSDRFPEAGLAPEPGTPERGLWYRWLVYLTNTVQPALIGFFGPARLAAGPEGEDAVKAGAIRQLDDYRRFVSAELAAGGPYLLGQRFTSADLYLAMLTRWTRRLEHRWWDDPDIGAHYRRIVARPASRRVWERQGLDDLA